MFRSNLIFESERERNNRNIEYYECWIVKFNRGDNNYGLRWKSAESLTVNLGPEIEFYYPTRVSNEIFFSILYRYTYNLQVYVRFITLATNGASQLESIQQLLLLGKKLNCNPFRKKILIELTNFITYNFLRHIVFVYILQRHSNTKC